MSLGTLALEHAKDLVGVMESGGNNRGKTVTQIIRANGGTGPEPWCGDFVAYCYKQAGSKSVQRKWAAVRYLGYLTGMRIVKRKPRPGDIVVFSFDHTGIYVSSHVRKGVRYIKTIEGNTGATGAVSDSKSGGDGVYVKLRALTLVSRFVRVYR